MAKLTKENIIYEIENNLFEAASLWASGHGGKFFEGEDIIWSYTATKTMNQILGALFKAADIESKIYNTLKRFREWGVPVEWICGPSTKPYDLGDYLEKHGLKFTEQWTGMALEMGQPVKKQAPLEGLTIKQVDTKDDEMLKKWIDIIVKSFNGWGEDDRQGIYSILADSAKAGKDKDFIKFTALYNNVQCSTGALYLGSESAGIYFAATLPEYRGKGIAGELMLKMLDFAVKKGRKLAVLHATKHGEGMYKKLGFKQYCKLNVYATEGYAT